jgi:TatD DNase family protein
MTYCDIHTHQPPVHPEDAAVVAIDIRQPYAFRPGYYAAGIHPRHAEDENALPLLRTLVAARPEVVAIGEAGLDKRASTPWPVQEKIFAAQAELAEEVKKPLIIHCVKAWPELTAIRKTVRPEAPWIIHGFRGGGELAGQLLRAGFFLSFGIRHQIRAVRLAWESRRLFAETDAEPVDIRDVYASLSAGLSIPEASLSQVIFDNFRKYVLEPV